MAARTEMINPDVKPAPQELQDKHYYRKHGANAYYGRGNIKSILRLALLFCASLFFGIELIGAINTPEDSSNTGKRVGLFDFDIRFHDIERSQTANAVDLVKGSDIIYSVETKNADFIVRGRRFFRARMSYFLKIGLY